MRRQLFLISRYWYGHNYIKNGYAVNGVIFTTEEKSYEIIHILLCILFDTIVLLQWV